MVRACIIFLLSPHPHNQIACIKALNGLVQVLRKTRNQEKESMELACFFSSSVQNMHVPFGETVPDRCDPERFPNFSHDQKSTSRPIAGVQKHGKLRHCNTQSRMTRTPVTAVAVDAGRSWKGIGRGPTSDFRKIAVKRMGKMQVARHIIESGAVSFGWCLLAAAEIW